MQWYAKRFFTNTIAPVKLSVGPVVFTVAALNFTSAQVDLTEDDKYSGTQVLFTGPTLKFNSAPVFLAVHRYCQFRPLWVFQYISVFLL